MSDWRKIRQGGVLNLVIGTIRTPGFQADAAESALPGPKPDESRNPPAAYRARSETGILLKGVRHAEAHPGK